MEDNIHDSERTVNRRKVLKTVGVTGTAAIGMGTASAAGSQSEYSMESAALDPEAAQAEFEHAMGTKEVQALHDSLKDRGHSFDQENVAAIEVDTEIISESFDQSDMSRDYTSELKGLNPVSVFAFFNNDSSEKRGLLNAIVLDDPDSGGRKAANTWATEFIPEIDRENQALDIEMEVLGVESVESNTGISPASSASSSSVATMDELTHTEDLTNYEGVSPADPLPFGVDWDDVLGTGACLTLMGALCNAYGGSVGIAQCVTTCTAAGIPIAIVGCDIVCIMATQIIKTYGCASGSAALCAAAGIGS
ncbi:hypothetical protein [Haloterrigena salifodinae]|uniref:hypothetical protein n=1 Tax=Haloterrigena salifodinae TaxID=2675099 RepID=UPI000F86D6A5|nr:hypothetical protein [Haloterrigena salifodinae]